MPRFLVTFIETTGLVYEIDSKDKNEAWEKWYDDVENGRVDFTDVEQIDSETYINELKK